jgi:hypothetical protein
MTVNSIITVAAHKAGMRQRQMARDRFLSLSEERNKIDEENNA